ncbi:MAG: hypothetical protein GXO90_08225 [FCB group bacterium]|nr:hypothetical protein [FCB group bacterium]
MKELDTILNEILDPELVLLDSRLDRTTGSWVVVVDSESGVTLDQTSRLAKKLVKHAEVEQQFPDGLQVEISSPGIDYPLTQLFQFKKNIGRKLKMDLAPKWASVPEKVRLNDVQGNVLHVSRQKKEFYIPLEDVKKAYVLVSFH